MRVGVMLWLGTAACGPSEWRPPSDADRIAIADELIARVEPDATISVTASVELDGRHAPGAVRLRHGQLATALTSPHVRLARARAWQALAVMLQNTPDQSFAALEQAYKQLEATTYGDDGLHLRANLARTSGDLPDAIDKMSRSVAIEIRQYVRRYHDELW